MLDPKSTSKPKKKIRIQSWKIVDAALKLAADIVKAAADGTLTTTEAVRIVADLEALAASLKPYHATA